MSATGLHGDRQSHGVTTAPVSAPPAPHERVLAGAHRLVDALAAHGGPDDRSEWLAVAGDCQSLINTLSAVQDRALAEAARRESVWAEDGTLEEVVHGAGRVVLDAADLAAPVIGASHHQAQRRVEQAVRLAAGRDPVEADRGHVPDPSGLDRLHQAMATGTIDAYRAGIVAFELEVAPADVADAILAALSGHYGDDGPALRRRTRVLLSRISPDLVRERARRARAATGLRRWASEPGVDEWHGTFPSEDAAAAWTAIDRLAHDLVADGTCTSIEQARGKALTDLVTSNATVEVQIVMTVPAETETPASPAATGAAPRAEAVSTGAGGVRPTILRRTDGAAALDNTQRPGTGDAPPGVDAPGATGSPASTAQMLIGGDASARVRPRDDSGDLVEVQGARPSEPLLVPRGWLRDHIPPTSRPRRRAVGPQGVQPRVVPCDPTTGARLDPDGHLSTDSYSPGTELAALVRARDGRCRFPGCSTAARFCDLDHVRPWPMGHTASRNLLTLCRRHHRIKQRAGWRVRLARDGTVTWTDPGGRSRTTSPLDALRSLVLADTTAEDRPEPPTTTAVADTGGKAWSALETHLEVHVEHLAVADAHPPPAALANHRRTSAAALRAELARRRLAAIPDVPPF